MNPANCLDTVVVSTVDGFGYASAKSSFEQELKKTAAVVSDIYNNFFMLYFLNYEISN
ncbi:hypothetical protein GCM10011518_43000 [Flavobacterium limi]|uniref:Uncharacterized protein n=1 Tax=Flavobacterium limi TaxID=2045105 RepID=A0ABQ1UXL6_9FLAO|nr:hypothetical protein GCM10011518_43000 [Flavobacterium limi]